MTIMEIITLIRLILEICKEIGLLAGDDRQALKAGLAFIIGEDNETS